MANMIKDLLAPSQAKLLDDQLRRRQLQEGVTNYGSDPLGKFLTAASGAQRASAGVGMAAERVLGGRQMGANEQIATNRINEAKKVALFNVQSNDSLSEDDKKKAISIIQSSESVPQLEAISKRYGKVTRQGSPAVEKLSDGSVVRITNDAVEEVVPPNLAGFMGLTQNEFQDQHDTGSIQKAEAIYQAGVKANKPEDVIRRDITAVLQPNVNDMVKESYAEYTQRAKGYAMFEGSLGRTVEALDNANVGTLGEAKQFFGKALEAIGVDINAIEDTELVNRILSKEVLNNAQFMKGSLSNADIEFLKQTVGQQATSLEGLKEALVELAVRKEVAYKVTKDFNKLNNKAKNSFDFEQAEMQYIKESREKYRDIFGMERRKSDKDIPPYLRRNQGEIPKPSEQDIVDFFSLPTSKR
jgi:hypothetical protein